MTELIHILQTRIPFLRDATQIDPILKGWSGEKKFMISLANRQRALLRTAPLDLYERKMEESRILIDLLPYAVRTPQSIEVGALENEGLCYQLLTYLEGEDAQEQLPSYTEQEQYQIGVEAGRDLIKMHHFQAPNTLDSWQNRQMVKHNRYIEAYRSCGVKIREDEKVLSFVDRHAHLLKDRPNRFQHDDFHPGNLIVKDKRYVGAIDFNRFDWGDPYFDFVKVALFSSEVSVPFSMGQIDGYFEQGGIPKDFWTLYAVYTAMTVLSSVVWTTRFFPQEVEQMLKRVDRLLADHQDFEQVVPLWYQQAKN